MSELVLIEAILRQTITGKMDIDALIDILHEPGLDSSIGNKKFINALIYKMSLDSAFEIDVDGDGDLILRELDENSVYHQMLEELYQILSQASDFEEFKYKICEKDLYKYFKNDEEIVGVYEYFKKSSFSNYKNMLFPRFSET